jgi:hypothetical protein
LPNREKRKAESGNAENQNGAVPQFESEEQFLDGLKSFLRAGRQCSAPGMARIARFWERKISFSILVAQQRLQRCKAAKAKVVPDGHSGGRVRKASVISSDLSSRSAE